MCDNISHYALKHSEFCPLEKDQWVTIFFFLIYVKNMYCYLFSHLNNLNLCNLFTPIWFSHPWAHPDDIPETLPGPPSLGWGKSWYQRIPGSLVPKAQPAPYPAAFLCSPSLYRCSQISILSCAWRAVPITIHSGAALWLGGETWFQG